MCSFRVIFFRIMIEMIGKKCAFALIISTVFFWQNAFACVDKFALSSVDARVHKQRNAKAIYLQQEHFNKMDNYIAIDIINANISELCEGMVQNFQHLETLILINLNLTLIEPGTFRDLPKLKHLSLSVNKIPSVPARTFNLIKSLQVLYLSKNEIETIEEGAFSNMPNLKAVHLEHNKISHLNGDIFVNSPKLSLINFNFNRLNRITTSSFADIQPGFGVRALNIFLKKNQISEIEAGSFKQPIPINLHLQYNELVQVPSVIFSMVNGSTLSVDNNRVSCIADDIIERLQIQNIAVNLKNNPVNCGCMKRIDEILSDRELKGELNVETTEFCLENYPGNNYK
ncbi:leucine-rich repeat-containing protein 15-like [Sitophilus oryzae]|uniref:Leucine-rich repeat-containing protein 15-like n=1 Tax=Sitophilus oryzae TaxID=7048 RepID=A0A6J2YM45_SITOR|nr:leucine-rich repeat-containing protein 15-like [Sitophilus oryzae]